jgi:hypothetical protein
LLAGGRWLVAFGPHLQKCASKAISPHPLPFRLCPLPFIDDWIMILPDELKKSFSQQILAYEEEQKMNYINSVEEFFMEKWMEKGMLQEGRNMVQEALSIRFSHIPGDISEKLLQIEDRSLLRDLLKKAIMADTIAVFEKELIADS